MFCGLETAGYTLRVLGSLWLKRMKTGPATTQTGQAGRQAGRRLNTTAHVNYSGCDVSENCSQWRIKCVINILYFADRASCYKFLLITNLTHCFVYLFISSLYMSRASQCSSSGDRIVLIHHLVWLVCVTAWYAWPAYQVCLTGIRSSDWHRLIIPDDVLIQFDLLIMSAVMLETCREMI